MLSTPYGHMAIIDAARDAAGRVWWLLMDERGDIFAELETVVMGCKGVEIELIA